MNRKVRLLPRSSTQPVKFDANAPYPGCGAVDIQAGTVQLALNFARDGNAPQIARRFNDLGASIVREMRARHGNLAIDAGHPAMAFADFCFRVAVALLETES